MVQGVTGWNDAFTQDFIKRSEAAAKGFQESLSKPAEKPAPQQSIMTQTPKEYTSKSSNGSIGWDKEFTDGIIQRSLQTPKDGPKVGDKKPTVASERQVQKRTVFVQSNKFDPEDFKAKNDNFGYMSDAQAKPAQQGSKKSRPCSDQSCDEKRIHSHPDLTQPWSPAGPIRTSRASKKDSTVIASPKALESLQAPMYSETIVSKNTSLWAIAKEQLAEGASNKDIANYVKEITKANNLKNPDLIKHGQKLKLPFTNAKRVETYQIQVENPRLATLEAREQAEAERLKGEKEAEAARSRVEKEALEARVAKYQTDVEEPRLLRAQRQAETAKIKKTITDGIKAARQDICESMAPLFKSFIPICEK